MEEEAKIEFTITVNWRREDGSIATTQLGTLDRGACRSAEDVGLQLADAKPILGRLQEIVVSEQLQRYCEAVRPCPRCHRRRHLKDYRCRRFDTVFGRLDVCAPRFDGCRHCGERLIASPVSELLPERVTPELRHLQTELAAQLPYRQAAALLEELLPETGGLNYATTRNRTLAVGKRIEEEICGEIDHPRVVPEPAERMVVGIDGAFVKAGHTRPGQRHQFEILTGRVETSQRVGEAFAVVRDLVSISVKTRPAKTWGPVDGRGHAMLGWRMEEEAKIEFTITVNWRREDGSIATTQLGTLDRGACRSAKDVGLQLADAKPILGRLQEIVVSEQLQRYCEAVRPCPRCHDRRHLKDYRRRRYDTVFGRLVVGAPRFDGCRHCGERRITSPVSDCCLSRQAPNSCICR